MTVKVGVSPLSDAAEMTVKVGVSSDLSELEDEDAAGGEPAGSRVGAL